MRQPRSIIFHAWALLAAQLALVAGVIAVVLVAAQARLANEAFSFTDWATAG